MSTFDIEKLLDAIRWQESRGDPNAVSPAGAKGPYQIMDFNTAEAIGDSGKVPLGGAQPIPRGMLTNEDRSRQFASEAVQGLIKKYNGDVKMALAAYNAGPGNIDKGRYPVETQKYVPSVLNRYDHEVASPSPERQRFDTVVAQKNGTQPSLLGEGVDMAADAQNDGGYSPEPVANEGIGTDFLQGRGLGTQAPQPMNIKPQPMGAEGAVAAADEAEEAEAGAVSPPQQPGFLERFRQTPGMSQALIRMGAGLAGNAHKGWGAGVGAAFGGAADAFDTAANQRIADERTGLENLDTKAAYPILLDHYMKNGDPQDVAAKKAAAVAFTNPKQTASILGIKDANEEDFGVAPEYFTDKDNNVVTAQYGNRGTTRYTDSQGNQLSGEQLQGLKRDSGLKKVSTKTEELLVDRQGVVVARYPINNQQAAVDEGAGKAQAKALEQLPAARSNASKIKQYIDDVVNDPQLPKFTGWQGLIPTWTPEGKAFKQKLEQINKQAFVAAYEGLKGAGQITEGEGGAATAAKARLDTLSISDPGYVEALKDFANEVDRMQQIAELKAQGKWNEATDLDRMFPRTAPTAAPAAPGAGISIRRIN